MAQQQQHWLAAGWQLCRSSSPLYTLIAVNHFETAPLVYLYDSRHHRVVCCDANGDRMHDFSCRDKWRPDQYHAFLVEVSRVTGWLYIALFEARWRSLKAGLTTAWPAQQLRSRGGQIVVIR